MRSYSLFCVSLFFLSCSGPVVNRNFEGRMTREKPRQHFNSIKKRVALLNFFNESPYGGDDLAITATEELRKELAATGQFIIDHQGSGIFGSSKEVYAGGGSKLVQLSRKAKIAGINFVISGRIIDARIRERRDEIGLVRKIASYTESKVEIRIFDVNGNKDIYTSVLKGYADENAYQFFATDENSRLQYRRDLLRYGVKVAVRRSIVEIIDISAKLDWVGRVAKIIGDKIYINAGRSSGIQISDILKAMTEGAEIYDPETGALIGISKGEVKGTLEIIDYFGPDGAIATLHSGGSVHEGDFVRLY